MSIRTLLSRADGSDVAVDLHDWRASRQRRKELLWVDLEGSDAGDLETVERRLTLGEAAARGLRSGPSHRPAATVHEEAVEVVVQCLANGLDADPAPLQVFIGQGWVITRHEASIAFLDEARERIQDQREVGLLSAVEFLASLLDWYLDTFFQAAEQLEREVDRLDDAALRSEGDLLDELVRMRRRIAHVRRILAPHREVFAELTRRDFLAGVPEQESRALAAIATRLDRAADAISNAREMLIGTFDLHMTRIAQRTNDVMRVLTLASVILLPSVVVAGVMGMNFKVGLFEEPNLFWVVIGLMVAMAVATLGVARWRGWL